MEIENIKFNKVELAINNLKEEVSKNNEIYFAKIESLKAEIKVLKIPKGQNKNDDLLLQPDEMTFDLLKWFLSHILSQLNKNHR